MKIIETLYNEGVDTSALLERANLLVHGDGLPRRV